MHRSGLQKNRSGRCRTHWRRSVRIMKRLFKQRIRVWLLLITVLPGCATPLKPTCPPPEAQEKPVPPELLESPKPLTESSTASERLPDSLKTLDEKINNLKQIISPSTKN